MEYFSNSNDLLKSNVFVGFFGVFVLFFIIFVVAYIYFKFFRKNSYSSKTKESEWLAQYQSLTTNSTGIQSTSYPESHERQNEESTYLSPLVNQIEIGNVRDLQRDDLTHGLNVGSDELYLGRERLSQDYTYAENELSASHVNRADYVYVEIEEHI